MKVLIIEPHPDDACLSFYEGIKRLIAAGHELSLVSAASLFINGYRDSEKFCERIGIKDWTAGGLENLFFKTNRVSHYDIRKATHPDDIQRQSYFPKFKENFIQIQKLLYPFKNKFNIVITGIGIYHPYHVITTMAVERCFLKDVYFWADYPYIKRKYGEAIQNDVMEGGELLSLIAVDPDEKEKAFAECYPSEKGIMRFDRKGLERDEILITKGSIRYSSTLKEKLRGL